MPGEKVSQGCLRVRGIRLQRNRVAPRSSGFSGYPSQGSPELKMQSADAPVPWRAERQRLALCQTAPLRNLVASFSWNRQPAGRKTTRAVEKCQRHRQGERKELLKSLSRSRELSFCLSSQQSQEFARVVVESVEDRVEPFHADVLGENLADYRAEVRGEREVAAVVELMVVQPGPFAVDLPALHVTAHEQHAIRVAMIGAAIAVFLSGAAEFAHSHEDDILHAVAHISMKRSQALAQVFQQTRQLPLHAAFVDVVVPAAAIDEKNFHADVGFKQLPDLLQALPEPVGGILRAVFRLIFGRVGFAQ